MVVGWGDAALAQQIARPSLYVDNYSQGFVRDPFACEATPHAPTTEESRVRVSNDPISFQ